MPAEMLIVRGEFQIEEPWRSPAGVDAHTLVRSTDGAPPRLATTVTAYYDDSCLTVLFTAMDDHVVATLTRHDDPLYDEDVVEVFLAPENPRSYYEMEVNPLGTIFDARIESPEGRRQTMQADRAWDCAGLFAAIRRLSMSDGISMVETVLRIPFASVVQSCPAPGAVWTGNFYRIDRHPTGDEYAAWSPTMKDPPDFHVPASFGRLVFRP